MTLTTADYDYTLAPELIAQAPLAERSASRMLVVHEAGIEHRRFSELPSFLAPSDLLVLNDTRVIPARLFATKDSGGRAELLVERVESDRVALSHVRASKSLKAGRTLTLTSGGAVRVLGRCGELYRLEFARPVLDVLATSGEVPLPPYIERKPDEADKARYQTVYAAVPGAVAAPTAGLHFDETMLDGLRTAGIEIAHITLHVGAGTFAPVRGGDLSTHELHSERVTVPQTTVDAVARVRERRGRVALAAERRGRIDDAHGHRGWRLAQ